MTKRISRQRIRRAVQDERLKLALERSANAYSAARAEAVQGINFPELQEHVRCIKERSISHLNELADRFAAEAERVGVVVYRAADAEDAGNYIAELAKNRGAKLAVKSKSMLTEEIRLNDHLQASGLKVIETDLGEWIIQLAGERPSHFTQPAVHMTREQVAEIFSKATGQEIEPDIPKLVQVARRELRQAFCDADIGITGANILIAETGSIVIVTNEGNSRLVSTLPPVHVAVVGYEKLVETMDEANEILKILARSGTGQKATAYVSFITGPSRTADIEKTLTLGVHGPGEVHVVLVDNGRMKMLDDEEMKEALYCIKCGACLNVCPIYRAIGGHVYGNSYMGGIGAILTAFHQDLSASEETLALCNGCGHCVEVCPSRIDIPRLTNSLRHRLVKRNGLSGPGKLLLRGVVKNPDVMQRCAGIARTLQKPFVSEGHICRAPFMPDFRTTPALARKSLSDLLPEVSSPEGDVKSRTALYGGCLVEYIYPDIGLSAAKVMVGGGVEVVRPSVPICCGAPAIYCGDFETAIDLARRTITALEDCRADYIVTVCPTCATTIADEFPRLLQGTQWENRALEIAGKVRDFSDFAVDMLKIQHNKMTGRITYHDPCHQVRGTGGGESSRELLEQSGLELVEMPESDVCCGFAGSYSMKFPDISGSILARKLENIESVESEIVVTDCPGCIMQIRGGIEKRGGGIKVYHTAQILAK